MFTFFQSYVPFIEINTSSPGATDPLFYFLSNRFFPPAFRESFLIPLTCLQATPAPTPPSRIAVSEPDPLRWYGPFRLDCPRDPQAVRPVASFQWKSSAGIFLRARSSSASDHRRICTPLLALGEEGTSRRWRMGIAEPSFPKPGRGFSVPARVPYGFLTLEDVVFNP